MESIHPYFQNDIYDHRCAECFLENTVISGFSFLETHTSPIAEILYQKRQNSLIQQS